jgi:hypothetical protein
MSIILVVFILVLACVILWASYRYVPAPWKWIPIGLVLLALVIWLFTLTGLTSGLNTRIR